MSKSSAELQAAGFSPVRRSPRRLIAIIQSITNAGKTYLALTGKRPIGYIAVEIGGEEGVVDKFIPEGAEESPDIHIARITMDEPAYVDATGLSDKDYQQRVTENVQVAAGAALDKFYAAYYASIANMATTIVDCGDDVWEIARLANFGRLERVPQLAYTQLNKSMDKLIDDSYSYGGSVFWLHHMTEKWITFTNDKGKEQGKPSGEFVMSGYKGAVDKVQAVIELWRDDLEEANPDTGRMIKFNAQVIKSRHNADWIGAKFHDDNINIAHIGSKLAGGKPEDWK